MIFFLPNYFLLIKIKKINIKERIKTQRTSMLSYRSQQLATQEHKTIIKADRLVRKKFTNTSNIIC